MADMKITNGPSALELALAWVFRDNDKNPHIVTFTVAGSGTLTYPGSKNKTKVEVSIDSLSHAEGGTRDEINFTGRIKRFDSDFSQKIEGVYFADQRDGEYELIESPFIPAII